MARRSTFRYTRGRAQTTMGLSVPPRQAIGAGWRLLRLGLWSLLTGRDTWITVDFAEQKK